MRSLLSLCFLAVFAFGFDSSFEFENTNIVSKKESNKADDYNRFRIYSSFSDIEYDSFLFDLTIDNYNNYSGEQADNNNETKIYRGYLKYSDEKNIITLGKQRIPFGVGRVWNPIDIYNPIDATAIESDERAGTSSFRYEYALNDLSSFDATISEDKYAARLKGYIGEADIGVLVLRDKDKDQSIFGYESSGEILNSGMELRSEGGYFKNDTSEDYKELIIGAEYGFENSFTILSEYKYNSLKSYDHLALNLSYTISSLWNTSYLIIKNLDDESSVSLLKFDHSLSDESELNFGTYFYDGNSLSEYGYLKNSVFIRLFIHL